MALTLYGSTGLVGKLFSEDGAAVGGIYWGRDATDSSIAKGGAFIGGKQE